MTATTRAFLKFLTGPARLARQLYLLGDLFEYWAGDDDLDAPFNRTIATALRAVSDAGVALFWIAGNRDFLIGPGFADAIGATLLTDGTVIELVAGQRIVLAHGDAECTDDTDYINFRNRVRQPVWQEQFLALPLQRRKAIIDDLRAQSRVAQQGKPSEIMDVNQAAIAALFANSGTTRMIHGHTHRPAQHVMLHNGVPTTRWVLPDWDCDSAHARGGWIGLDHTGQISRFGLEDLGVDISARPQV